MQRAALIGLGAIGQQLAEELEHEAGMELVGALVRSGASSTGSLTTVETLEELLAANPSVVVEAAGQDAVREHGANLLEAGVDLMVISSGALADEELDRPLSAAAQQSAARSKPPAAWRGTPAAELVDLAGLDAAHVFFEGSARDAARRYPKNANLAATVALAGLGLDETEVALVADPAVEGNVGRIEAEGAAGAITVEARGPAAAGNPKTSAVTAFSMIASLRSRDAPLVLPA